MSGPVLDEATIDGVHEGYRSGGLTCSRLVEFYLQRVRRFDLRTGGRPPLNSIVSVAPDVREQAAQCDRELAAGGVSKPLQGIPVWVKDNISVAGLAASAGLLDFCDAVAREDAALVANLRRAGAIILGTTSMTGLGMGVDAWGSRFGRAGNVYDTREEPGGSSHGPAIAISANFGMVAAGVDDCCSITLPAALNGAVGLRPTVGRVPREGVVLACTDTSPGPIARTVSDLRRALKAMEAPGAVPPDGPRRVAGRRIGVLVRAGNEAFTVPEEMRAPFEQALRDLGSLGATVVPDVHLKAVRMNRVSSLAYHNALVVHLKARSAPPTTMRELFQRGLLAPGALNDIGRSPIAALWPNVRLPDVFAPWYRRIIRGNQQALSQELDQQGLDALVFLSLPKHATLATVTQAPQLTVPAGTVRKPETGTELPVGLSFLGRPWDEDAVLELAEAYESWTRHRRPPRFQEEPSSDERLDVAQFNAVKLAVAHRVRDTMRPRGRTEAPLSPEEFTAAVDGVKQELGYRD